MTTTEPEHEPRREPEHKIVVGYDGSPPATDALGWAARQASMTGAQLEVVTAWEWPTNYGWEGTLPEDYDPAADAEHLADVALDQVRAEHPGVDARPGVLESHPAAALLEASQNAELLVIGSRGHGELAGILLGSVSEHCVAHATCPVVVMRTPKDNKTHKDRKDHKEHGGKRGHKEGEAHGWRHRRK